MDGPIRSYGLIVYCYDSDYKFLIYKRKDSYEYIDLLKGKYSSLKEYLELVSRLDPDEVKRLNKYEFDELWIDCMYRDFEVIYPKISKDISEKTPKLTPKMERMYVFSKRKYEEYKKYIPKDSYYKETEWGFPKGRKDRSETELECAIREFREETNTTFNINIEDGKPFLDTYIGSDGKCYSTKYFVGRCDKLYDIPKIYSISSIRKIVSPEASDVKWVGINEAKIKLNHRHIPILKRLCHTL